MLKKLFICCMAITLLWGAAPLWAQTAFTLKSAPPDLNVYYNGEAIKPVSSANGHRNYRISGEGILRFSADGYKAQEYPSNALPVKKGIVGIKLENETGIAELRGEYKTGEQPKSVYFSPDGQRLFVPLLAEHGIDVFRLTGQTLSFEKRLTVPNSRTEGFVEAFFDEKRRELWFSNMVENKAHIYDLDTLEYKTSLPTGGELSKVIVQSPDGKLTIISNWVTENLSVFDSDTKKLLRRIPVGGIPRGMAFSPDGSLLYTAIYDTPLIAVVDMNEYKVSKRFRVRDGNTGAVRHVIYRDG